VDLALRYETWLAGAGVERGLLGPREAERLWDRHLLNSAVLGDLLAPGETVVDVGSGAGLPGIPLALARPDCSYVLLEPLARRAAFLAEVVADLALPNVRVLRARAEDHARERPAYDVAVARAVAPLDRLAGWCLPLLRPGGRLLALKGDRAGAEVAAAPALRASIATVGAGVVDPPATVVTVVRPKEKR
jgi:16S rRNA (guanine527-N7)-methyltransferase